MPTLPASLRSPLAFAALAAVWLLAATSRSHPTGEDGHHHGIKDGTDDVAPDSGGPSDEEKALRMKQLRKRADERNARIVEIRKDRRMALRRRLASKLEGYALDPAMAKELSTHARRMARLKRVRYVAATEGDYDTVQKVDMLIGKENSRHEGWWRTIRREAVRKAVQDKSKAKPPTGASSARGPKRPGF